MHFRRDIAARALKQRGEILPGKPLVSIVMGSDSDLEIMQEAGKALDGFGIAYEIDVTSAHRSPGSYG